MIAWILTAVVVFTLLIKAGKALGEMDRDARNTLRRP